MITIMTYHLLYFVLPRYQQIFRPLGEREVKLNQCQVPIFHTSVAVYIAVSWWIILNITI